MGVFPLGYPADEETYRKATRLVPTQLESAKSGGIWDYPQRSGTRPAGAATGVRMRHHRTSAATSHGTSVTFARAFLFVRHENSIV